MITPALLGGTHKWMRQAPSFRMGNTFGNWIPGLHRQLLAYRVPLFNQKFKGELTFPWLAFSKTPRKLRDIAYFAPVC